MSKEPTVIRPEASALVADPKEGMVLYLAQKEVMSDEDLFLAGIMMRIRQDPEFVAEMMLWITNSELAEKEVLH